MFPLSRRTSTAVRVSSLALATLFTAGVAGRPATAKRPAITEMPKVDGTDFYMFRSYETGREGYVTLIANYMPLQDAYGGPNYFALDPDACYRIHIDNDGDGVEDITFQFRVATGSAQTSRCRSAAPAGVGAARSTSGRSRRARRPRPRTTRRELHAVRSSAARSQRAARCSVATKPSAGGNRFAKPVDNIGQQDDPRLRGLRQPVHLRRSDIPGCDGSGPRLRRPAQGVVRGQPGRGLRPGQHRNPARARATPSANAIDDKNITTFALEVPIACLTERQRSGDRRLDDRARCRATARSAPTPTFEAPATESGRLRPGLAPRHAAGQRGRDRPQGQEPVQRQPRRGTTWRTSPTYVTNPTLPELLEILFGASGAPEQLPAHRPGGGVRHRRRGPEPARRRRDAAAQHLDRADARRRRRTTSASSAATTPASRTAGGRATTWSTSSCGSRWASSATPSPASSATRPTRRPGNLPFTDGTLQDAAPVRRTFPYLRAPLPGSPN